MPEELFAKKDSGDDQKLTKKQVDKGLVRLKFIHPLSGSPLRDVFPTINWVWKMCGGKEENAVKKLDVTSTMQSAMKEVMQEAQKKKSTFRMLQQKARQIDPKERDGAKLRAIMDEWAAINGGDLDLANRLADYENKDEDKGSADEEEDDQIMNMYADIVGEHKFESQIQKTQKIKEAE